MVFRTTGRFVAAVLLEQLKHSKVVLIWHKSNIEEMWFSHDMQIDESHDAALRLIEYNNLFLFLFFLASPAMQK